MRHFLEDLFAAAVAAAQPAVCLPPALPRSHAGRLVVIGAGKASAEMARVVEAHWKGSLSGVVVTRYGYGARCERIEVLEASHPVPDAAGLAASKRLFDAVRGLQPEDLVLCLLSGGGSALLPCPLPAMTLADEQALNQALLASGASISEMNCVRRHVSAIKGGRLGAACHPAQLLTLALSDVPGDDPSDIASGPTVPDPTTSADALAIIQRYRLSLPEAVLETLRSSAAESVKPGDPRLSAARFQLLATPQVALEAAAARARDAGIAAYILGDAIEGEAREVGKVMAGIALEVARYGQPFKTPCVLLSGGETTVTVRGQGRGGRNVEFLLSLAIALHGAESVYALAADTDGVDGQEEIAGAFVEPATLRKAHERGIDPLAALADNDGHGFFGALGASVVTGPTRTNVNDFRAIYISGAS